MPALTVLCLRVSRVVETAATNSRTTGDKTMDGMDGTYAPPLPPPPHQPPRSQPPPPPATALGSGRSNHHLDGITDGFEDGSDGAGEAACGWEIC